MPQSIGLLTQVHTYRCCCYCYASDRGRRAIGCSCHVMYLHCTTLQCAIGRAGVLLSAAVRRCRGVLRSRAQHGPLSPAEHGHVLQHPVREGEAGRAVRPGSLGGGGGEVLSGELLRGGQLLLTQGSPREGGAVLPKGAASQRAVPVCVDADGTRIHGAAEHVCGHPMLS